MANPRAFLKIWIVSLAGLALAVGAVNLLVDPYEVFGTPRIAGVSGFKPAAKNHSMLAKTYQIARAHPTTVLIGSSSTHIGIDAYATQWPAGMRPVYNYGVPGEAATSASLRTLQEAVTAGGVKNALVFVDFQNFLVPETSATELTEDDRRYRILVDGTENPHRPLQMANDILLSLATMGALVDSVTTVISQDKSNVLNLTPRGSSNEADFIEAARLDGMHDLFAQKAGYEVKRVTRLRQAVAGWDGPLPNLDIIANLIAFAHAHDVRLALAITPRHADALEIYWRFGLWPRVEQFKAQLAAMAAAGDVTLWDFMDYSTFTTEGVPASGDRRRPTSWFWESTHYKKQLGEVMIERMFGANAPRFGAKLTPDTVAGRNAEVRTQRQSVVCDGTGERPLSTLARPIPDGCNQIGHVAKQHGPT